MTPNFKEALWLLACQVLTIGCENRQQGRPCIEDHFEVAIIGGLPYPIHVCDRYLLDKPD